MDLQALIDRAGGAAAFNVLAVEVLTEQPPTNESANLFDDPALLHAVYAGTLSAFHQFLRAPPTGHDWPTIAVSLSLRPYGQRQRRVEARPAWWKRQDAAPGWVDCAHADIFAVHLVWMVRFRRLYNRIHGLLLGPNRASAHGRAAILDQLSAQAAFEHSHPDAVELSSDDDTLSDVSDEEQDNCSDSSVSVDVDDYVPFSS